MAKKYNGGPAFPMPGYKYLDEQHFTQYAKALPGMSMRDFMAAKAMQALVTSGLNTGAWEDYDDLSKSAWAIADAMLRAREAS